ncbi:PPP5 phosphatase, partial [Cochlearius cochlearius]|nr:PPP5 phosphatase [Cochlearius cochlearius]
KDYENAVKYYSSAIELNPTNAIYYGNRSLAYLRTECYGYALADATRAVELDKKYVKGYYRRAASNMALGKFKAALRDYETLAGEGQQGPDGPAGTCPCCPLVSSATGGGGGVRFAAIEDEYSGPKLDGGKVTLAFMKELMQWALSWHLVTSCGAMSPISGPGVELWGCVLGTLCLVPLPILDCGGLAPCPSRVLGAEPWGFVPLSPRPRVWQCHRNPAGNHETDNMNQIYGFEGEVKAKYTAQMFALFSEVFEWLPLAQCINGKVLIMHGGLFSEDGVTLDDIRKIERNRQPPDSGPMCDLLWSDPQPQNGRSISKRGVSCQFGPDVTKSFLERNRLDYIIRSHEVKPEGYEVAHDGKCVTVFSAPNY